ncbi:MAG: hypothetical protein CL557_12390 [Alphaproteobacteria bacterium]|nr:hypothetical protein [Alphaproteobacteria bacterium]
MGCLLLLGIAVILLGKVLFMGLMMKVNVWLWQIQLLWISCRMVMDKGLLMNTTQQGVYGTGLKLYTLVIWVLNIDIFMLNVLI